MTEKKAAGCARPTGAMVGEKPAKEKNRRAINKGE